jgi:hypothetical protein
MDLTKENTLLFECSVLYVLDDFWSSVVHRLRGWLNFAQSADFSALHETSVYVFSFYPILLQVIVSSWNLPIVIYFPVFRFSSTPAHSFSAAFQLRQVSFNLSPIKGLAILRSAFLFHALY